MTGLASYILGYRSSAPLGQENLHCHKICQGDLNTTVYVCRVEILTQKCTLCNWSRILFIHSCVIISAGGPAELVVQDFYVSSGFPHPNTLRLYPIVSGFCSWITIGMWRGHLVWFGDYTFTSFLQGVSLSHRASIRPMQIIQPFCNHVGNWMLSRESSWHLPSSSCSSVSAALQAWSHALRFQVSLLFVWH